MGRDAWPDFSVQISSRPWRCVPDPLLCLSRDGAAFVSALAGAHEVGHSPRAEVWMAPEFHSILDNWMLYDQHPELLAQSLGGPSDPDELRQALRVWLRLRDTAGRPDGRLCWVRDAVRESCLPAGIGDSVVPRWEAMAQALDERLANSSETQWTGNRRHARLRCALRRADRRGAVMRARIGRSGSDAAALPSSAGLGSSLPTPRNCGRPCRA